MTQPHVGRERDLDRFLTFIDAVVAIAITLLVLPLVDVATGAGNANAGDVIRHHGSELLGFLLSFTVIARLWYSQHRIVSSLVVQRPLVSRALLAWTLTIVFLPFPTALVAETASQSVTKILYIGTMAVSAALLAVIGWAVAHDRSIRDTDEGPDPARLAATVVTFALALAISLAFPVTSYYPLLVLLLDDPAVKAIRRILAHRRSADDPQLGGPSADGVRPASAYPGTSEGDSLGAVVSQPDHPRRQPDGTRPQGCSEPR